MTETLYLQLYEGTKTWWFGGKDSEDLYRSDWYTNLHGSPGLVC